MILSVIKMFQANFGKVEELVVCANLGDHMIGNVYVKVFSRHSFLTKKVYCVFIPSCFRGTHKASYSCSSQLLRLGLKEAFLLARLCFRSQPDYSIASAMELFHCFDLGFGQKQRCIQRSFSIHSDAGSPYRCRPTGAGPQVQGQVQGQEHRVSNTGWSINCLHSASGIVS